VTPSLTSFSVEFDGRALDPGLMNGATEIRVHQNLSAPAMFELAFLDESARASVRQFRTGTAISVIADQRPLFDGEITAVESSYGPSNVREIRIRGYDRLHRLRKRQKVRAFVNTTALEIARELLSADGVTVESEGSGPLFSHLIQARQTDFDLLVDVASQCGWYATLRGDILQLVTLKGRGQAVSLEYGKNLLEATIELNNDSYCSAVKAEGWNTSLAEPHAGQSGNARAGRRLAEAIGQMEGGGERLLLDEMTEDDGHAELLSQAELDYRAAREVIVSGVALGDDRLRPGVPISIDGVAEDLCGTYVTTSVEHVLSNESGYISRFTTEPPQRRQRPYPTMATLALVSNVNDPENLSRVCVRLAAYDNVETSWLPVLSLGAGEGKGMFLMPDVNDRVLVLMPRENTAQGIVLGGLYGSKSPEDSGLEHGAIRRYGLRTAGGHRLVFDDASQSLRMQDIHGSYVDFSAKNLVLHSTTDLRIEAPGRNVVILGDTIDFQRG
jgi:phage baseplate assembly protein gpV/phage protein D